MLFSIIGMDLTVQGALTALFVLVLVYLVSLTFHEWAHSFVAYKQGDLTPKIAGRLSLNPAKHLDFWGFICFMVAGIGWAKPVPINPTNFKKFRSGIAKVSIAGVSANAILMVVSSFFYILLNNLVGGINFFLSFLILFFRWSMQINAFLIVFNLLPIYPLDGFNFISSFMRSNNKFIDFNVRNGYKIFIYIILIDLFLDLFLGISIISFVLGNLSYILYRPLELLWGLIF